MKTQRVIGVIIIIIGLYLVVDGTDSNKSEMWLGCIFFLLGAWFGLTKQEIF